MVGDAHDCLQVVSFNNIIAITNNVVPILLSFYLGSWSDQLGRLPFLAIYMLGRTLAGLANFLNAVYLEEWGRWVWLATVMPPLNLSGGIVSYIIMIYSFMSDITSERDRTFRMALSSFCWRISSLIGLPLSALIYNNMGYTGVMATGFGLYVLTSLYLLIRFWGFKENIKKSKFDLAELLSPKHPIQIIKASFRSRPGRKQIYILLMMLVMMAFMMPEDAETMVQFMYTKRKFQWEYDTFSYYNTIQMVMSMVGVVLIMPLFHYFNGNDNVIIISSGISKILSQLVRAFARTEKVFFFSTVVGTLRIIYNAPVRAQISRCVEPQELGKVNPIDIYKPSDDHAKVFAMLGVFEAIVPIIASSVFTKLYNATSELDYPWDGSYYFGTIGVVIIGKYVA